MFLYNDNIILHYGIFYEDIKPTCTNPNFDPWTPASTNLFSLEICIPTCAKSGKFLKSEYELLSCVVGCQEGEVLVSLNSYGGIKACQKTCTDNCEVCDFEDFCIKCKENHYLTPDLRFCVPICSSELSILNDKSGFSKQHSFFIFFFWIDYRFKK